MKRIALYPKTILFLLTLAVLFIFFGKTIVNPNAYLFAWGDGLKNYYTPLWFVKYGTGNHFSGMNYPYGEVVTFTDNQPLLSWGLHFISKHIIDISGIVIGIMNSLMIFSFVPTTLLLFLILRHFRLPNWYAIVCSLLIGFFSPQLDRWGGHYGLSYMFFIPLVWWLIIRFFNESKSFLWWIAIIISITLLGFIHLYYLMISCAFLFLFSVGWIIANRVQSGVMRKFTLAILAVALPLIIMSAYSYFADPIKDRVEAPWGFFFYVATFNSVFLPLPEQNFLNIRSSFFDMGSMNFEGMVYVGIAGAIVLLLTFLRAINYLFRKKWRNVLFPVLPKELLITLWASVFILFYSMCLPFSWNMQWLVNYLSLLKQFRSLGRFAWVFYYVYTVYSCYYLFLIYRRLCINKLKGIAVTLILVLFATWAFDVETRLYYHQKGLYSQEYASSFLNVDDYPKWLKQAGYTSSDFQAILPLPFFNMGSERITVGQESSPYEAFKSSYLLGLPIATCMMSRTSISQAMKTAQLLADPLIERQVLKDYPNKKPLLVVSTKESLNGANDYITRRSKMIFENESVRMYLLPLENLTPDYTTVRACKVKFDSTQGNRLIKADLLPDAIVYKHFENNASPYLFNENGAAYVEDGDLNLYKGKINGASDNMQLSFTAWVKMFKEPETDPTLWYKQYDAAGNIVEQRDLSPGYSFDIINDWIRIPCNFTLLSKNNTVEFYFRGNKIAVSEMIIRPSESSVITNEKPDGSFFFDNTPIPPK